MNAFLIAWRVSRFVPRTWVRGLAGLGAWLAWLRHGRSVHRLEDNLRRVTGLEGKALRRLSRRSMASTARYYAEALELPRMTGAQIDARMRTVGMQGPVASHRKDGTVGVVLSHSGNWDLVGGWTCRNLDTVRTVAEILEPRKVFEEFVAFREALGMTVLGHEGSSTFRQLIRIAKNDGGVIALLADRDLSGDGVQVEMWGHRVRVAPGPAALALATDTDLYPLSAHYERLRGSRRRAARSKWGSVMVFGAKVEVPEGSRSEQVQKMSQQWASAIAEQIAEHPEDWHMMQRFGWVE